MKRLFLLFLLPALSVYFSSCQKIKEEIQKVTTTTVSTDIAVPVTIDKADIQLQADSTVFDIEKQYQITNNPVINEYKDKIQGVKVVGLKVRVVNADPENMTLRHAKFVLQELNNTTKAYEHNITKPFALTAGNVYIMHETDANWQLVNDIINDLQDIKLRAIGVAGSPSGVFSHIDFEFVIKIKATASIEI